MAYKITGGRTVGKPRSSSSSSSGAKLSGGRTVGTPRTTEEAWTEKFKGTRPSDTGRPGFTPIRVALDVLSIPNATIGKAIRDPRGALTYSALDAFRNRDRDTIGRSVEGRGLLNWVPEGKWRSVTKLGLDIALDPTTYVTFGAGGAARATGNAAVRRVGSEALDQAAAKGQKITLADRALASARDQEAIAAAGRSVRLGVQVPFSRAKNVTLYQSRELQRAIDAVGGAIVPKRAREAIAKGVSPSRGVDQRVNQVAQDVRRMAATEQRALTAALRLADRQTRKAERALGLKRGEAANAIAFHIDNPAKYQIPTELEPLVEAAKKLRDRFPEEEFKAGIEYARRENYLPHLGATRKDSERIQELYAKPTANAIDDPFFVNPRISENLDQFKAIGEAQGFTAETNVWKLLERRGFASIKAREKKALDDAIFQVYGVKAPAVALPSTEKAAARVAKQEAKLAAAVQTGDAPAAVRAQAKLGKATTGLAKVEQKRGAAELLNAKNAARPGRQAEPGEYEDLLREWAEVGTATKYHGGSLLPPDIQRALSQVHKDITKQVTDPDGIAGALRFINRTTSQWKGLALLSPGYHARNAWSDSLQAYWAGARNPQSFVQATRILKARKALANGENAADATIAIGRGKNRRTWTLTELAERARVHGVIDTGQVRADLMSSADSAIRGRLPASPGRGRIVQKSGDFGDFRENTFRLGTWLELLKRGDDPAAAAAQVRQYLYDYGEVGRFVQAARAFWLPFITYQSKALPNVIRMAAERPGRLASVDKTTQYLTESAGSPDLSLLPTGQRSSFAVPIPTAVRARLGLPTDQPLLVTPERLFSYGSLNVLDARPAAFRRNVLGGLLGPIPRVSTELATQKSLYFGSDFSKRARAPRVIQELSNRGVPIPGYGPKADYITGAPGFGYDPSLDAVLRLFPQYGQQASLTGPSDTARIGWLRYLTGFPASPYDQARRQATVEKFKSRE